jgi:hypothetical protein
VPRSAVDPDETLLLDWLRHYGALIALFVLAGMLASAAARAALAKAEAATLLVDRAAPVTTRELGTVAEAVFRSDAAVRPAMTTLGIDVSAERFLADSVQLRPVPGSRVLIVVGRAPSADRAAEISSAMSRSLIAALSAAGLQGFTILSAGTSAGSASLVATLALGGFAGLLLGVGVALIWYRARRPVLSLRRALDILPVSDVRAIDGRAGWRGALRRRPRFGRSRRRGLELGSLLPAGEAPTIAVPGASRRIERAVARRVLATGDVRAGRRPRTLLVVDARCRERDLEFEALRREPSELGVVWVR